MVLYVYLQNRADPAIMQQEEEDPALASRKAELFALIDNFVNVQRAGIEEKQANNHCDSGEKKVNDHRENEEKKVNDHCDNEEKKVNGHRDDEEKHVNDHHDNKEKKVNDHCDKGEKKVNDHRDNEEKKVNDHRDGEEKQINGHPDEKDQMECEIPVEDCSLPNGHLKEEDADIGKQQDLGALKNVSQCSDGIIEEMDCSSPGNLKTKDSSKCSGDTFTPLLALSIEEEFSSPDGNFTKGCKW